MKKIILSCLIACWALQLSAQKTTTPENAKARSITEQLTELYQLNGTQADKMYRIQSRKQKQLQQIQSLESSNPELYLKKLRSLQEGNEGSVQLLLNREQKKRYDLNFQKLRKQRADKAAAMKKQGASAAEIERAVLAIE